MSLYSASLSHGAVYRIKEGVETANEATYNLAIQFRIESKGLRLYLHVGRKLDERNVRDEEKEK